ncbi:MAG: formylglycine-generating enzyme family protein, partial [Muribaculaceae bacterium]
LSFTVMQPGMSGFLNLPDTDNWQGWTLCDDVTTSGDSIVTVKVNGVSFNMIPVEAASFTMGATEEQTGYEADELPTHKVKLSRNYLIGETEVTQALWSAVMDASRGSAGAGSIGDNYPQFNISWNECCTFIAKLSAFTGIPFRMPTEAEWEFAARGGLKSQHYIYSGSSSLDQVGWNTGNSGYTSNLVKQKQPNELGIYDMSGNVWEWCSDRYDLYSSVYQVDPIGALSGDNRVLRGGAWNCNASNCRISKRGNSAPTSSSSAIGLRLAVTNGEVYSSKSASKTFAVKGVVFRMIEVEGGTFKMGATPEQGNDAYGDEKPTHDVTVSSYYIAETEVTQALWYALMHEKPGVSNNDKWNSKYGFGDDFPAYFVSWDRCQEFITELNNITGAKFRMPTEAEWEFAARGGNKAKGFKYCGSNSIDEVAWYGGGTTHKVAQKKPNELGLYDMSGNVDEWCSDWYDSNNYSGDVDPTGPATGDYKVLRGGCFRSSQIQCRVSYRYNLIPTNYYFDSSISHYPGLRLVLPVD